MTFTSNGKRGFVPRDQVSLHLSFTVLYFYTKICSSTQFLIDKNFYWAVFICSFSILRNSQLQSDVCRLPYTWSLNSLITQSKLKRRQILCLNAKLQLPKFIRYSRKADFRQKFRLPPSSLTFPFSPSHFFNFSFPVSFLSFAGHFRGFDSFWRKTFSGKPSELWNYFEWSIGEWWDKIFIRIFG